MSAAGPLTARAPFRTVLRMNLIELEDILETSHDEATILVTRYEAPDVPEEQPVNIETAISEEIWAGLVCI